MRSRPQLSQSHQDRGTNVSKTVKVSLLSEFSTVFDDNLALGGSTGASAAFDLLDQVVVFDNSSENNMSTIQPGGNNGGDEKLTSVGVGSSIGHGQESGLGVLQAEVFIFEFVSINRFTSSSVSSGKVTTLDHEVGDDSVEGRSLEVQGLSSNSGSILTSGEGSEVLNSLGDILTEQSQNDSTSFFTVDFNIEKDLVGHSS
mmetsp:Transcript_62401/g.71567  ORF Transcript_62401/g.71567 Transcript_62401/m.71567 type:complete len:201 (+) Transcript_62401:2354-2956(+)